MEQRVIDMPIGTMFELGGSGTISIKISEKEMWCHKYMQKFDIDQRHIGRVLNARVKTRIFFEDIFIWTPFMYENVYYIKTHYVSAFSITEKKEKTFCPDTAIVPCHLLFTGEV